MNFHIHSLFFRVALIFAFAFLGRVALAQTEVQSYDVEVTCHKTSSVIFPTVIRSVDRGSSDIIAQKAKDVDNVLQLKAGREDFPETNLTVITADGRLHQFTVNYSKKPRHMSLQIEAGEDKQPIPMIFQTEMTESDLQACAEKIVESGKVFVIRGEREHKISLFLNGIYIKKDIMFYHFTMTNTSNINYDIDFLRFYIRDQEKVKRTASQELEVQPLYVYGNNKKIVSNKRQEVVFAMNKFTIPDAKNLVIEMFEKNGGRHLDLAIKNRTIVNAKSIN